MMWRDLLGGAHWIVLLVVVVLLFGASRLPAVAKSLGQSMKIFKSEMKEMREDKGGGDVTTDAPTDAPNPDDGPRA